LHYVRNENYSMKDARPSSRFSFDDRAVLPLLRFRDKLGEILNRHGVVDPRVAKRISQFLADNADKLAPATNHGTAGCPWVIGDRVEYINIPGIRSVIDASPSVKLGVRGNNPVLDG